LQIRALSSEPDFVPKAAPATMKFSGSAIFDGQKENGIMKNCNPTEGMCQQRETHCAQ